MDKKGPSVVVPPPQANMYKLSQTKKQVTSSSTSTDPGGNHDRARLTRKGTLVRNMKALLDGGFGTSRATASPPISTTGSPKGFVHQRNKSLPNPPNRDSVSSTLRRRNRRYTVVNLPRRVPERNGRYVVWTLATAPLISHMLASMRVHRLRL